MYFLVAVCGACRARYYRLVSQIAIDIGRQFRRRAIPAGAVFFQSLQGDPVQVSAQQACQLSWIRAPALRRGRRGRVSADSGARTRRILFVQLAQDYMERFGLPLLGIKGQQTRKKFIEHDAQRINVCPGVYIGHGGIRLLWAHISRCPHHSSGTRYQRLVFTLLRDGLGDTEVDNARHRLAIDFNNQNVGRLQIAMHDRFLMRMLHRLHKP